ncbi:MAG: enoyl-CoA hydratase-related protein [bacterium]|nr:enoyl-CoA hydratase-related protein [bacterium]
MSDRIDFNTLYLLKDGPVATMTFNRPDIRNAFNAQMILDIIEGIAQVNAMDDVRVLVITGAGSAFSAGADLNWMKSMKDFSYEENIADAEALADSMHAIFTCRKPTIARVNGAAIGGGNGLVCACDIAIAAEEAVFSLSEVKIGLVPACIGLYVVKRVGEANARYLMLSGRRLNGVEAAEYGLVNWAVPLGNLNDEIDMLVEKLLTSGPQAMWMVKELIRNVPSMSFREARTYTAKMIAELRTSDEGQEGLSAFLEKRKPKWV